MSHNPQKEKGRLLVAPYWTVHLISQGEHRYSIRVFRVRPNENNKRETPSKTKKKVKEISMHQQ